ncbi:hypothetical protein [Kineosporia succinea]|uniref:Uncharacterized protein n=1 Tax=Kineosporia succinea TaxID=84632 RepID=A0ABT9NXD1_9ACTN|nr:hypothetical protein [Kineosporia succinea]MDP9825082.1 hypothetical protein [Kineosporia succinea]
MSDPGAAQSAILDRTWASAIVHARRAGVPPSLAEAATAHRLAGDWRGACAAASVDLGAGLRGDIPTEILSDLGHFAPDLLRWHLPRNLPEGTPRPGLVVALAEYPHAVLVVRVVRAERLEIDVTTGVSARAAPWRLTGHRYLWDASRAHEYGLLTADVADASDASDASDVADASGSSGDPVTQAQDAGDFDSAWRLAGFRLAVGGRSRETPHRRQVLTRMPVDLRRLESERRRLFGESVVAFRPGGGLAVVLGPGASGVDAYVTTAFEAAGLPVMPRAAWMRPLDHELLRLGLIGRDDLHPLQGGASRPDDGTLAVDCLGAAHRLCRTPSGWVPLDHTGEQIRTELMLARLGAPMTGCFQALGHAEKIRAEHLSRFAAEPVPVPRPVPQLHDRLRSGRRPKAPVLSKRSRRNTKPLLGAHVPPPSSKGGPALTHTVIAWTWPSA